LPLHYSSLFYYPETDQEGQSDRRQEPQLERTLNGYQHWNQRQAVGYRGYQKPDLDAFQESRRQLPPPVAADAAATIGAGRGKSWQ